MHKSSDPTIKEHELLDMIRRCLREPTTEQQQFDESLVLLGGDPSEVVVTVTDDEVSVAEFAMIWDSPCTARVRPKLLAVFNWKYMPEDHIVELLPQMIRLARRLRRAKYQTCKKCSQMTTPEQRTYDHVCHSCAEKYYGVVH